MYASITIFEICLCWKSYPIFSRESSEKRKGTAGFPFKCGSLLSAEGHAVGALLHGRIAFVGAHQNLVQGAVVLALAVMGALTDGALHTFVGMTVHILSPPFP